MRDVDIFMDGESRAANLAVVNRGFAIRAGLIAEAMSTPWGKTALMEAMAAPIMERLLFHGRRDPFDV